MQLPNPKELKALLKVCREYGVTDIEVDKLKLRLGELPKDSTGSEDNGADIPAAISDEDLAYWSSQPDPLAKRLESQ